MERPDSRLIRVFLSSTFVDFQEERSLLVQQVFPSLRRRARSRGVEIVDVDLRWGVTEEQTKRGETLPLCLGEIDRCRPYFISLLGERYGWVPPPDYYKPELLERQPWLKERLGGASVTELEILHGVLRNPEMAGHACFYFRDPAYAQARSAAGWVADTPTERQRLAALKARIRASGFPVAEGLANPQAIAERIEADLWRLIESRFPELEPADALEREERKHADYRRARTALYLGGEPAIEQLESWIAQGEQRILITGESGAGKSALIANWLEAHQRNQPQDLVHAHHLGCTNDASAVRPLLGRLIDTASQWLLESGSITEPFIVPKAWRNLTEIVRSKILRDLGHWLKAENRRLILVLDGLDRLVLDDQKSLPWLPANIPEGVYVVASALDCPACSILHKRGYRTHEICPLGEEEQQQLIKRYLSRYGKQLESDLQQRILAHPLASSPLFLKVLLEQLRQCACYDTLDNNLAIYLATDSIDGLYAKVLERLENDGYGEATRKSLTALWASRGGLSETELLAVSGLSPLEWAPVDLALSEVFGRNGERLTFDLDFLRSAVENRYLQIEVDQRKAHSNLADWFGAHCEWNERVSEELPWQLQQAHRIEDLKNFLLHANGIEMLLRFGRCGREVANYCIESKCSESTVYERLICLWKNTKCEPARLKDYSADFPGFSSWLPGFSSQLLDAVDGACNSLIALDIINSSERVWLELDITSYQFGIFTVQNALAARTEIDETVQVIDKTRSLASLLPKEVFGRQSNLMSMIFDDAISLSKNTFDRLDSVFNRLNFVMRNPKHFFVDSSETPAFFEWTMSILQDLLSAEASVWVSLLALRSELKKLHEARQEYFSVLQCFDNLLQTERIYKGSLVSLAMLRRINLARLLIYKFYFSNGFKLLKESLDLCVTIDRVSVAQHRPVSRINSLARLISHFLGVILSRRGYSD